MKKILYLLVVAVLLAACNSEPKTEPKDLAVTYTNGKVCEVRATYDRNRKIQFDTTRMEEIPQPLHVLVSNDTIWLNSSSISTFNRYKYRTLHVNFDYNIEGEKSTVLKVQEGEHGDYYAVMEFGKFFDMDKVVHVFFAITSSEDRSPNDKELDLRLQQVIYVMNLDQFKDQNK